jgi:hypothetical protein
MELQAAEQRYSDWHILASGISEGKVICTLYSIYTLCTVVIHQNQICLLLPTAS